MPRRNGKHNGHKPRRFTKRQQRYRSNRLQGMNQYNAALAAGYSLAMAQHHSKEIEDRVKPCIDDLLEQVGITDLRYAREVREELEATKTIGASILVTKDGQLIRAEDEGAIEVKDHTTRMKALELIGRIKNYVKDGSAAVVDASKHLTLNVYVPEGKLSGHTLDAQAGLSVQAPDE
jgi:phage terminase small subunit